MDLFLLDPSRTRLDIARQSFSHSFRQNAAIQQEQYSIGDAISCMIPCSLSIREH
jgi:hypothetical protein